VVQGVKTCSVAMMFSQEGIFLAHKYPRTLLC
jgi:hypothetical protein